MFAAHRITQEAAFLGERLIGVGDFGQEDVFVFPGDDVPGARDPVRARNLRAETCARRGCRTAPDGAAGRTDRNTSSATRGLTKSAFMTPRSTSFFETKGDNLCDYSNALRRHNANCFGDEIRPDKPLDKPLLPLAALRLSGRHANAKPQAAKRN